MSRCRSCQAEILWVVTASGKRMPLDATPNPSGNVAITGTTGRHQLHAVVLGPGDRLKPENDDGLRYTSHFATCSYAASHRERNRR